MATYDEERIFAQMDGAEHQRQEELKERYEKRQQWFKDRVGKRIWRNKTSCKCGVCASVYLNGLTPADEIHAMYLNDCESEMPPLKYFDTKEERDEYEKNLPDSFEKIGE